MVDPLPSNLTFPESPPKGTGSNLVISCPFVLDCVALSYSFGLLASF